MLQETLSQIVMIKMHIHVEELERESESLRNDKSWRTWQESEPQRNDKRVSLREMINLDVLGNLHCSE